MKVDPAVPVKDPIVERVYDYTKWHIALHAAILVVLASGKVDPSPHDRLPWYFCAAIFCVAIAGVAAGTVASCLSRRERWAGFLEQKTFPLIPDKYNIGLTMQCWIQIQHGALWLGIFAGLGGAFVSRH